jgi:orotidine-5'-phosphate decarboxylase
MSSPHLQTYNERAKKHANKAAKALLEIMEEKQSNLSVSVDVTKSKDFFDIIEAVGPHVCLIKASVTSSELSLNAYGATERPTSMYSKILTRL